MLCLLIKIILYYHNQSRAVTKISSCGVNTARRWGIKQIGIPFYSSFL